jgi:mannose/fructose-specific phosphotransferase system component IIA
VTGVNLPMVIKLATQEQDEKLDELARRVRDQGQQQIHLTSDILAPQKR